MAIGTEITDGQIVDRNSAWISKRLTEAGVEVVEHRAIADDRTEVERALHDLAPRVDALFVTGGLGPTSDDFTRECLGKFCERDLEFDESSWTHIEQRFASRGLQAKPIQRQQCFFPRGSRVLRNNAGTANAFSFDHSIGTHALRVYALPGPPLEIASVWEEHLVDEIAALTPNEFREDLLLIRTLGSGESAIAEIVEPLIAGSGLKVGYRAHVPYVEVKLWYRVAELPRLRPILEAVEAAIKAYVVGHGSEDLVDAILVAASKGRHISIRDHATGGLLEERVLERLRTRRPPDTTGSLSIESSLLGNARVAISANADVEITLEEREGSKSWVLSVKKTGQRLHELEVASTPLYNFGTERGRKYFCEVVFQTIASLGI